uniref:Uncharacterized protein n=1 Tax=Knipowitschia caucasica TaxID=637954 RepID=A0AAV2J5G7_KNICA
MCTSSRPPPDLLQTSSRPPRSAVGHTMKRSSSSSSLSTRHLCVRPAVLSLRAPPEEAPPSRRWDGGVSRVNVVFIFHYERGQAQT